MGIVLGSVKNKTETVVGFSQELWAASGLNLDRGVDGLAREVYCLLGSAGVLLLERGGLLQSEAELRMVGLLEESALPYLG